MTRTRRPSGSVSAGTGGVTVGALTEPTSLTSVLSCATWGEFIAPTLSIPRARRHTEGGAARPAFGVRSGAPHSKFGIFQIWNEVPEMTMRDRSRFRATMVAPPKAEPRHEPHSSRRVLRKRFEWTAWRTRRQPGYSAE